MSLNRANKWIASLPVYESGKAKVASTNQPIRLASNESALGPSPMVGEVVAKAGEFHRYPSADGTELRQSLASHHRIPPENIICTNGSDELLTLIARGWGDTGKVAVVTKHGFLYYPIAAASSGAEVVEVEMSPNLTASVDGLIAAANKPNVSMVLLANPNNPTGTVLTGNQLLRLCEEVPSEVLIVIDSAYAEYAPGDAPAYDSGDDSADTPHSPTISTAYEDGINLVRKFPNVIMVRTFSKIYGIAALRVGWGFSSTANINLLHRLRAPFNLNGIGNAAAIAALKDQPFAKKVKAHTLRWRATLTDQLTSQGLEVLPSATNFLTVGCGKPAMGVVQALEQQAILVRGLQSMGLENHFRFSIGSDEEMEKLLKALPASLAKGLANP